MGHLLDALRGLWGSSSSTYYSGTFVGNHVHKVLKVNTLTFMISSYETKNYRQRIPPNYVRLLQVWPRRGALH